MIDAIVKHLSDTFAMDTEAEVFITVADYRKDWDDSCEKAEYEVRAVISMSDEDWYEVFVQLLRKFKDSRTVKVEETERVRTFTVFPSIDEVRQLFNDYPDAVLHFDSTDTLYGESLYRSGNSYEIRTTRGEITSYDTLVNVYSWFIVGHRGQPMRVTYGDKIPETADNLSDDEIKKLLMNHPVKLYIEPLTQGVISLCGKRFHYENGMWVSTLMRDDGSQNVIQSDSFERAYNFFRGVLDRTIHVVNK